MLSIALFIVGLACTCGAILAAFGAFRSGAAVRTGRAAALGTASTARRQRDGRGKASKSGGAVRDEAFPDRGDIAGGDDRRRRVADDAAGGGGPGDAAAVHKGAVGGRPEGRGPAEPEVRSAGPEDAVGIVDAGPAADSAGRVLDETEIFAMLHGLALGVEPPTGIVPPRHDAVLSAVASAASSAAAQSRYAIRRPRLLPKLLHAMQDDETSRRELARIISQDPALVGNLLKLANSALYRISPQPVENIDRAVAILGTQGIRSLVAAAMAQPVFRPRGGAFASFPGVTWEHTLRAAAAAEAHAAFAEKSDRFAAQLLGLLTGLGSIVVYRIVRDRYATRRGLKPDPEVFAAALDAHTAVTARRIAAGWKLSDRILEALDAKALRGHAPAPTALGRSLRFGRITGALAVLHANGLIDADTARASTPSSGPNTLPESVTSRLLFDAGRAIHDSARGSAGV